MPSKTANAGPGGISTPRLTPRKVSGDVADYLMAQLFKGELRTGDRLDLEQIAEILGVSHAPVREAVVVLERDGVLVTRYHRGVFVAPFTAESVVETFELYGALSGLAASRVARERDAETNSALDAAARRLRAAPSPDEAAAIHWEIRSIIHHRGASLRVRSLLRNFGGFLPASAQLIGPVELQADSRDLLKVLRAIQAGRPAAAAEAAFQNSSRIGHRVADVLNRRGVFTSETEQPDMQTLGDRRRFFDRIIDVGGPERPMK